MGVLYAKVAGAWQAINVPGVPPGGQIGDYLTKRSATNYDTQWQSGAPVSYQRRYRSAAQSLTNGAWTAIDFDSIRQENNPNAYIGYSGGSDRAFVINRTGLYLFTFTMQSFGTTGRRAVLFSTDGQITGEWSRGGVQNLTTAGIALMHTDMRWCTAGEKISALVFQDSGAAVNQALSPWDFSCALIEGPIGPVGPTGPGGSTRLAYGVSPSRDQTQGIAPFCQQTFTLTSQRLIKIEAFATYQYVST